MKATELTSILTKNDIVFLTGVPCSYLKDLLLGLDGQNGSFRHIAASSEGEAVGIAAGYHLATGKVPLIYMQNSGLGNAVNPLTSLLDKEVYGIPCLLFLSWRGEPGQIDEPQHKKMGRIMLDLLKDLEIPYEFASVDAAKTSESIDRLKTVAVAEQKPAALIFRPKVIDKSETPSMPTEPDLMKREEILEMLLAKIGERPIVTTTGKTSREVFELRERNEQSHQYDFLTVGSMGCAAGIGLGITQAINKKVFVIDGDGAVLMKMGTLATIGHYQPPGLVHIVIDNNSYESTGNQPTTSTTLDWQQIFRGVNYREAVTIRTRDELAKLQFTEDEKGPQAIVIFARTGSRPDLGRPTGTPKQNKRNFMNFLKKVKTIS